MTDIKTDVAALIEALIGLLCSLTGHFHCCWIPNKLLAKPYKWAVLTSLSHYNNPNTSSVGTTTTIIWDELT